MTSPSRPTLAVYWAGSCGGCDVAILGLDEALPALARDFEIVFWPCLTDFRHRDLAARGDGSIDLCLFDGALRTTHDVEMARLLRRKARTLVAFGSCAHEGCIPALANLTPTERLLSLVLGDCEGDRETTDPGLPPLLQSVPPLHEVVPVDATVPGCPPEADRIREVIDLFRDAFSGRRPLPPPGAVLGAGTTAVCEECPLQRREGRIEAFLRPHQLLPDGTTCLLDLGLVCSGPATRNGCDARCPRVGMPCRGCYGPAEGFEDAGGQLVAALAAVIGAGSPEHSPDRVRREVAAAVASLADPAGTLYRFGLGAAPRPRQGDGEREPR